MIALAMPGITPADVERVQQTMLDGWVSTAGPVVADFERFLGNVVGLREVVATSSGTAAIQLALSALGVGPEDDVLVSDLTFIAPANAIRLCGATPRFIDARASDWQLDTDMLTRLLNEYEPHETGPRHRRSGRRLAALVLVHLLGSLADIPLVRHLAQSAGVPLIEDAAQAMGARWGSDPFCSGSCGEVDNRIVCTSFNGNKLVTTGAGGAAMTDNARLAERLRHLASVAREPDHPWDYRHDEIGYNAKMNSMSAALGRSQLERLPELASRSRRIGKYLEGALHDCAKVVPMLVPRQVASTYWNLAVTLSDDSRSAAQRLKDAGVEARRPWMPVRRQSPFRNADVLTETAADTLWRQGLLLPCRPTLSDLEVEELARVLPRQLARFAS